MAKGTFWTLVFPVGPDLLHPFLAYPESMSRFLRLGKRIASSLPPVVGEFVARIPYGWRLGPEYARAQKAIDDFSDLSPGARRELLLSRLQKAVQMMWRDVPWYRRFLQDNQFHPDELKTWEDWQEVPILTKEELKGVSLEQRSRGSRSRLLLNTGGSSGTPLSFYVDRHAFAREWAHMHQIWERVGYDPTAIKLTFRGRKLDDQMMLYDALHNEYVVNTYAPPQKVTPVVAELLRKSTVEFLHGYPSAISQFATAWANEPTVVEPLRASLKGVLLGSEYPAPTYRNVIEDVFGAPTVSWYGHSEMAVLAMERERFVYEPFHTYGYVEAVPEGNGGYRLVGTGYHNVAAPFIRYDTGDRIEPIDSRQGLLLAFRVKEGRVGEFVVDRNGNQIPLTALVFGRHHRLFDWAQFIQVRQRGPGVAVILVTIPPGCAKGPEAAASDFDAAGVEIEFSFELRREPVRTPAGKVPLLVS